MSTGRRLLESEEDVAATHRRWAEAWCRDRNLTPQDVDDLADLLAKTWREAREDLW